MRETSVIEQAGRFYRQWKFAGHDDNPIRAELFAPEKLVEQAKLLAQAQKIEPGVPPNTKLLTGFQKNSAFLHAAYASIADAASGGDPIPPAEEWFIDNFHVIADQLAGIKEDLPKKFYQELPSLASGPLQGYARAYEMALQLIAHTDSRLDADTLRDYIQSYQSVSTLTTGELWAIAILLRVALIENLQRLIRLSDRERDARRDANVFADRLIAAVSNAEIAAILKERSQDPRKIGGAFAVQLILRLRDTPPAHLSAVEWLYDQFSRTGTDASELIRHKHQDLAAAQVSVSNLIQSLRLLATVDWSEMVEDVSAVHAELSKDPSGHYLLCDFATRDRYRHVIEAIGKKSDRAETEISRLAIELAANSQKTDPENLHALHVGYYLIAEGRDQLEKHCGYKRGFAETLARIVHTHPGLFYQVPIVGLSIFLTLFVCLNAGTANNIWLLLLAIGAYLLPASALAVMITNWILPLFLKPKILPKLELAEGIPEEYRTFIVLPSLLLNSAEVEELVSRLEITYLANNEDTLEFALLTDFGDSNVETSPADEALLTEATDAIRALNGKYPRTEGPRFYLYHRRRLWNEAEGKWMGWERKRGKLEEFNRLLLGRKDTSYLSRDVPPGVKYVITLDSDTILPRDSARKLVGTLTHPLNAAVIDPEINQVVEGYGILQPRVSHTITGANQTWFARIFSGHTGIDPYTTAVSDTYQDLFGEASYVGKGIYDVAAFSATTDPRFPENRLLSHDLIEGAVARTALTSDVEIFDDHPSDYTSYIIRLHRWVRGDWQVAPWILPRVPGPDGVAIPNTLSWLNRWKLFDNLRRSLVSPALFLCFVLGWTILPGSPAFWSGVVLAVLFAPVFVQFISGILSPLGKARWLGRLWGLTYDAAYNSLQSFLQLTFLPNEAWVMVDAISRTFFRMLQRRKMLEWTTAAQAEKLRGSRFIEYILRLRGALVLSIVALILVLVLKPVSLSVALPFLLLWLSSPVFTYLTGKQIPRRERTIPPFMIPVLRGYAREIWRFFETLVGEETHWLPPDNFQETPEPLVAPRTSPTNIGFLFLSNIAAYDLGYIGAVELVERTEKTLNTLSHLKTFNGHLFNWYSTATLEPLEPRYISTVDSGNLVAALIILKQFALRFGLNLSRSPEHGAGRYDGVRDTIQQFLVQTENAPEIGKRNREVLGRIKALAAIEPHDGNSHQEVLEKLKETLASIDLSAAAVKEDVNWWWNASQRVVATHLADYERPQDIASRLVAISREAEALAQEVDFRFLFQKKRGIFSIGFNVTSGQLDRSFYDLFASEARLASFVAIANGDVPQSHWFRMSRAMTSFGRRRVLLSWSGSMFEYLMPLLFLANEPKTLMDVTYRSSVDLHRIYGMEHTVPWGISEAAYNARDLSKNYQYGPFGVPSLGLKRGLARDLVVAPYATFLALMVKPVAAFRNLEQIKKMGAHGRFGFYESIDFTKDRVPKGESFSIVRTFMAHHHGMSLMSLVNVIQNDVMQQRFHSDPAVRATSLLLQEKMPLAVRSAPVHVVDERMEILRSVEPSIAREFHNLFVTPPRTQLLSNGNYHVMVTTGGGGYSESDGIRINRWREDVTRDQWGPFLYLRDLQSGEFWSAGFLPTLRVPDDYRVVFAEDQVEIRRRDGAIETNFDVSVSPEDNVEIRRVNLVNTSGDAREIEITSYMELVLNTAAADLAHPAFSNLFVETEYVPELKTLIASRRARSADEQVYWSAHLMTPETGNVEIHEYETDRARFVGRNRDVRNPVSLSTQTPLSCTTGAVLDPIFSVRCKIRLEPYSRQMVAIMTMIGRSREEVIGLAEKYCNTRAISRAKELAAIHAQIRLSQLSLTREDADLFQRIAGRLIYSDLSLRARPAVLTRSTGVQSALWPYGISGDLPICLVRIEDQSEIDMVRQMLRAHDYWRSKGLSVDLVILNEFPSSYFQELQEELLAVIRSDPSHQRMDVSGGIYLRRADLMPEQDQILLRTVARVQIVAQRGSLARQVARTGASDPLPKPHIRLADYPIIEAPLNIPVPDLILDNGFGGFTVDGKEYVIELKENEYTPAPWINVIGNPAFGFHISESGAGMTWSGNSHENRLTPWSNDAVSDPVDSAIYIRDDESGLFWSPTPKPAPAKGNYVIAHGAGYTRFNYGAYGLDQELLVYTANDSPVKILKLRLRNTTRRSRRLTVTHYAELVLGVTRDQSAHFVQTSIDSVTGALLATNSYNNEFAGRVVFLWMNDPKRTVSGDRTTFIGPNGNLQTPAAMGHAQLSGKVGAGLDPCAAVQGQIQLGPLSEQTVLFLFGEGKNLTEVRDFIRNLNTVEAAEKAREKTEQHWNQTFDSIQVKTPDPEFDLMMNRWLLYQTYSCRFFSRSAFYQSGGAFGFRDQLQDAMALVYSNPQLLRDHLLLCASRQFIEGDVQHWWHPPTGRGVRTRSSDDLLWMPYAAAHYIRITGDYDVLDETAPYLESPPLDPEQMEAYLQPEKSAVHGSLYEHCLKAIEHSLQFGEHGLPLIKSGDWNDGMNRLGIEGKGESVWLAWFQISILKEFVSICEARHDMSRADQFRKTVNDIVAAVEKHGWDGEWYRRGFDDEGVPFGSSENEECRIDSIAQSWAVLSHSADATRTQKAMQAVEKMLIDRKNQLALLFTPPFVETTRDPGYIKGYLAGIRENGGHYNHAAIWLIAAFAELGDAGKALEIFHMCSSVQRTASRENAEKYKLEPYVVAGDIYSHPMHKARGGWSWYTGSAGWLYRAGLEWILGFRLQGDHFTLQPRIPDSWREFEVTFRHGETMYRVHVEKRAGVANQVRSIELDGTALEGDAIPLTGAAGNHRIKLVM